MGTDAKDYGRWIISNTSGPDGLHYTETPVSFSLGSNDVLVRLYAASINARDLNITMGIGKRLATASLKDLLVPGSDGAGVVIETGPEVTMFERGDKVVTHIALHIPDDALPSVTDLEEGLGDKTDGTLRRYGVFKQTALVPMPETLSFAQAATLCCSGLTAWNALMESQRRRVGPGDFVLVQGSGGVSIAALQIAIAAGATVVATTSNDQKALRLEALGVTRTINYTTCKSWGQLAKSFTPDFRGFDFVIDIGGYATLSQSMASARINGVVCATGGLGGFDVEKPDIFEVLLKGINLRGVLVGGRSMFRDLVQFIDEHQVKPVLDDTVFNFKDAKQAYQMLKEHQHFSKISIQID